MAIPNIDWDEWSQPAIEPFMEAIIHFPSGNVLINDVDISSVSFTSNMFDSSHVLFGPPEPATGSMEIIDYEQTYNPVYNEELDSGIQIDLYLGLWPLNTDDHLGQNIVSSFEQPIEVEYLGNDVWACVVHIIDTYLYPLSRYRLEYSYKPNGSTEIFTDYFVVPGTWFERHIYAITHAEQFTVVNVVIQEVKPLKQKYGVFFSQEWTYDTSTHTATVDFIDGLSDLLLTDNRVDGYAPAINVNLHNFIVYLLQRYSSIEDHITSSTITLPYSFYESTQAGTINNAVEAICASLIAAHDGLFHLFQLSWYETNILLMDEDVESYEIRQSSIASYDSVKVSAMLPSRKIGVELLKLENITIVWPNSFEFTTPHIFDVYQINIDKEGTKYLDAYNASIKSIFWRISTSQFIKTFSVIGSVIEFAEKESDTLLAGSTPYEIKSNNYIPTVEDADVISTYLSQYIFKRYFEVKVSLRGCYGFWVGAKIHLFSQMYGIDADYIITCLDYSYSGAVHTTLTLQRIS